MSRSAGAEDRAGIISLETPIGEEEDSHLGDFIEDRQVVSPAEAVINLNLKDRPIGPQDLTPRGKVIKMRFGVGAAASTLEEVGQTSRSHAAHPSVEGEGAAQARHPSRAVSSARSSRTNHLMTRV